MDLVRFVDNKSVYTSDMMFVQVSCVCAFCIMASWKSLCPRNFGCTGTRGGTESLCHKWFLCFWGGKCLTSKLNKLTCTLYRMSEHETEFGWTWQIWTHFCGFLLFSFPPIVMPEWKRMFFQNVNVELSKSWPAWTIFHHTMILGEWSFFHQPQNKLAYLGRDHPTSHFLKGLFYINTFS